MRAGTRCLRYLRENGGIATKAELAVHCEQSEQTIQRALDWLRDDHGVPLEFNRPRHVWTLANPDFTLPLLDPTADDLAAVLFAAALLDPIVGEETNERLRRVVESMDNLVREQACEPTIRSTAVKATATTGQRVEPGVVAALLLAAGRRPVRVQYSSPWTNTTHVYELEPWQLRIHDGTWYLRAWSRTSIGPRTFRVAQFQTCVALESNEPRQPIPARDELWGDDAYGVDEDRPDIAVFEIRGPFARWLAMDTWHTSQRDEWIVEGQVLRRTLAYNSCREFARRLLTLGDALGHVEPPALRREVAAHVAVMTAATSD